MKPDFWSLPSGRHRSATAALIGRRPPAPPPAAAASGRRAASGRLPQRDPLGPVCINVRAVPIPHYSCVGRTTRDSRHGLPDGIFSRSECPSSSSTFGRCAGRRRRPAPAPAAAAAVLQRGRGFGGPLGGRLPPAAAGCVVGRRRVLSVSASAHDGHVEHRTVPVQLPVTDRCRTAVADPSPSSALRPAEPCALRNG